MNLETFLKEKLLHIGLRGEREPKIAVLPLAEYMALLNEADMHLRFTAQTASSARDSLYVYGVETRIDHSVYELNFAYSEVCAYCGNEFKPENREGDKCKGCGSENVRLLWCRRSKED